ncbi:hypothetical protein BGX38DRAFT_1194078 [Terfezia claveryi]|nr:hypothetical protein BGX38DRAFT_1194078 [Terfezia claveryi]
MFIRGSRLVVSKIQNMAAVNIINQLNQIQEQMRGMEQSIQQQNGSNGAENPWKATGITIVCVDRFHYFQRIELNADIRIKKSRPSYLVHKFLMRWHQLEPLYSIENELIEGFSAINGLDGGYAEGDLELFGRKNRFGHAAFNWQGEGREAASKSQLSRMMVGENSMLLIRGPLCHYCNFIA